MTKKNENILFWSHVFMIVYYQTTFAPSETYQEIWFDKLYFETVENKQKNSDLLRIYSSGFYNLLNTLTNTYLFELLGENKVEETISRGENLSCQLG